MADRLARHPGVAAVHHPGLPDHPQHALAAAQLPDADAGDQLAQEAAARSPRCTGT